MNKKEVTAEGREWMVENLPKSKEFLKGMIKEWRRNLSASPTGTGYYATTFHRLLRLKILDDSIEVAENRCNRAEKKVIELEARIRSLNARYNRHGSTAVRAPVHLNLRCRGKRIDYLSETVYD